MSATQNEAGLDLAMLERLWAFLKDKLSPEDLVRAQTMAADPSVDEITNIDKGGGLALDRLSPEVRRQARNMIERHRAMAAANFQDRWGNLTGHIKGGY